MSTLIEETEDYLVLEGYVHSNSDSYSPWELDENSNEKYGGTVHEAEHFALYEFRIRYQIWKKTGEVVYLKFDNWDLAN